MAADATVKVHNATHIHTGPRRSGTNISVHDEHGNPAARSRVEFHEQADEEIHPGMLLQSPRELTRIEHADADGHPTHDARHETATRTEIAGGESEQLATGTKLRLHPQRVRAAGDVEPARIGNPAGVTTLYGLPVLPVGRSKLANGTTVDVKPSPAGSSPRLDTVTLTREDFEALLSRRGREPTRSVEHFAGPADAAAVEEMQREARRLALRPDVGESVDPTVTTTEGEPASEDDKKKDVSFEGTPPPAEPGK